jgi:mRNA interferase MazF
VVVQSDDLPLSTLLVAPTSTSARAASFRPEINIEGRTTRVLAEQTAAADPNRLGDLVGHLRFDELRQVDAALRLVLDL